MLDENLMEEVLQGRGNGGGTAGGGKNECERDQKYERVALRRFHRWNAGYHGFGKRDSGRESVELR